MIDVEQPYVKIGAGLGANAVLGCNPLEGSFVIPQLQRSWLISTMHVQYGKEVTKYSCPSRRP